MEDAGDFTTSYRIGIIGAIVTIFGTLLSGPLAYLAVSSIQPQPPWSDVATYIANYHPIQSATFYFGYLLLLGSVLMIASIYVLDGRGIKALLALVFTAIACGLIGFNYFSEATLMPAWIRHYTEALDPLIAVFAVTNPISLFWAVEMWGYGFLGLGSWLASGFFADGGLERVAKVLFQLNGVVSIVGALWTAVRLEWVLTPAGLVSYAAWSVLYLALAVVFLLVLRRRRDAAGAPTG